MKLMMKDLVQKGMLQCALFFHLLQSHDVYGVSARSSWGSLR